MIQVYKNTDEIAEAIASLLLELAQKPGSDALHIALSGGNTPKAIFKYLAQNYGIKLANPRFHFWWGDDRCVAPDNDESNYKWANELWLEPIGIKPENIHRVMGENLPESEALRYAESMKHYVPLINGIPAIDLNILGLGDDGHTASIFPHCMDLLQHEDFCAVASHPITGQKRITFTGKVLNMARKTVFVATGAAKAPMIRKVAIENLSAYPASHIQPLSGDLSWFIDEAASAELDLTALNLGAK